MHYGNRFQIVIRDVAAGLTPQAFAAAVSAVSDGGFINYLGMQVNTVGSNLLTLCFWLCLFLYALLELNSTATFSEIRQGRR